MKINKKFGIGAFAVVWCAMGLAYALSGVTYEWLKINGTVTANSQTELDISVNRLDFTSSADTIDMGAATDVITMGTGTDIIDTGDDTDTVTLGAGTDTIDTGGDADTVTLGAGADTIDTGDDSDTLQMNLGDDYIRLGGGNDYIYTGAADDQLVFGPGNDYIRFYGGYDGASTETIGFNDVSDTAAPTTRIQYTSSTDTIEIKSNSGDVVINLGQ